MNARQYRAHLYEHRSHPQTSASRAEASDKGALYLSLFAFIAAEYFLELKVNRLPSGLMFPFGFLIFWAFYYTYYQPGQLEKTLSSEKKWDISGVPMTVLTTCILFVKVVVVELIEKLISGLLSSRQPKVNPRAASRRTTHFHSRTQPLHEPKPQRLRETIPHSKVSELPKELTNALGIMGIPEARDWGIIQKRYRELAKKYHPDLNPELTQAGNRFMLYDAAYRKLELAKHRYFNFKKLD